MKRYFIYIIMAVATLFVGCTPDINTTPEMTDVGDIEVSFSVNGAEVDNLDLSSVSQEVVVDVTLNNENVYWTPVADKEWCQIVEEEHRGSGSFTIKIDPNNSFDAREEATITFVAGEYSITKLAVNHAGNVFLFDQNYAVSLNGSSTVTTKVKTIDGVVWDFDNSGWISGTKGASTSADGITTTDITITWNENSNASRLGELHLVAEGDNRSDGLFYVWQYGNDVEYDADGNILVAEQDAEPLEVRAPAGVVKEVKTPSWVEVTSVSNSDRTVSFMLQFAGNPSDARLIRSSEISLVMLAGTADVELPVIKQMYYAIEGLMTGEGLKAFATAWNAGEDVSIWNVDGVPTLLQDIDMSEVEGWVSIGTEERPYTGKFNGNNKPIKGLKAECPLFGVCQDAEIEKVVIDETSSFVMFGDYSGDYYLSALAADVRSTLINGCVNKASVQLESGSTSGNVYIAGLVGKVDAASYVQDCTNKGAVNATNGCVLGSGDAYVGGLVACNAGFVYRGFNDATVSSSAGATNHYVGGVVGKCEMGATFQLNSNATPVSFKSPRASTAAYVGGVAGVADGTFTENTNEGKITIETASNALYVGGVAALVSAETTVLSKNSNRVQADFNLSGASKIIYAGGHFGKLDFEGYTEEAAEGVEFGGSFTMTAPASGARLYLGGVIGYVNGAVTLKNITRNGSMTFNFNTDAFKINPCYIGGIVGVSTGGLLTIDTATATGDIKFNTATKVVDGAYAIGGVVGAADEGVALNNVSNESTINWDKNGGQKNGAPFHTAGVVAKVTDGNVTITNCHNKANIHSWHYNNRGYLAQTTFNTTAGILGIVGTESVDSDYDGTVLISGCTSASQITSYRGFTAGIVGFVKNATIENCSFTGKMPFKTSAQINPYYAGIVGGAISSTVKDCVVKASFDGMSAGSNTVVGGGIAGLLTKSSVVEACSTFSHCAAQTNASKAEYVGAVVGYADETCTIKDTRYGGSVLGTDLTANNFAKWIQGTAADGSGVSQAKVENCTFWNGE